MSRLVLQLNDSEESWTFTAPVVTIGREHDCDLVLEGSRYPSVSRYHARIHLEGGEAAIEDLQSANGLLLNGVKISRGRLRAGDRIALGSESAALLVRQLSVGSAAAQATQVSGSAAPTMVSPAPAVLSSAPTIVGAAPAGAGSAATVVGAAPVGSGFAPTMVAPAVVAPGSATVVTSARPAGTGPVPPAASGSGSAATVVRAAPAGASATQVLSPGLAGPAAAAPAAAMYSGGRSASSRPADVAEAASENWNAGAGFAPPESDTNMRGLKMLLWVVIALNVVLFVVLFNAVAETTSHVRQLQQLSANAVASFQPQLNAQIQALDNRLDNAQKQMQASQEQFAARMQQDIPKIMDQYLNNKMQQLRRDQPNLAQQLGKPAPR